MAYALRRVPGPFEVDILQAEVGRDQGLITTRNRNYCAVVPNTDSAAEPDARSSYGAVSKTTNQRFLRQRHSAINIQGCCSTTVLGELPLFSLRTLRNP
jgi:hypothetical protein